MIPGPMEAEKRQEAPGIPPVKRIHAVHDNRPAGQVDELLRDLPAHPGAAASARYDDNPVHAAILPSRFSHFLKGILLKRK